MLYTPSLMRIFLILVALALSSFTSLVDQNTLTIDSPSFADVKTAKIELANGLQAYLVSDPHLDKSGAALVVGAGSIDDPDNALGLAHFTEHMLFMGTEKYPSVDDYDHYIFSHGGAMNASTWSDRTAYAFTISNEAFEGALDRFSQFFISPIFAPSTLSKEMHAVNQENEKYKEDDPRRQELVITLGLNPASPASRFSVGTLDTLGKVSQEDLHKWWSQHYGAQTMRLVVYSTLPLDQLQTLVEADFSAIQPAGDIPASFGPLFGEQKGKLFVIQPQQGTSAVTFYFDTERTYLPQARLLAAALSDETKSSYAGQLIDRGWVIDASVDVQPVRDRLLVALSLDLSPEGVKHWQDIVSATEQTLTALQENGLSKAYFDLQDKSARLLYQWQPKQELFGQLMQEAYALGDEPMLSFPENSVLIPSYDPAAFHDMMKSFHLSQSMVALMADGLVDTKKALQDPWYHTLYQVTTLPPLKPNVIAPPTVAESNPYLPEELVVESLPQLTEPKKIIDRKGLTVYWMPDNQFHTPQTAALIRLRPERCDSLGARSDALRDVAVQMATVRATNDTYLATEAGSAITWENKDGGIVINIFGFSPAMAPTLHSVVTSLVNPDSTIYSDARSALLQKYAEQENDLPYKQGIALTKQVLQETNAAPARKAKFLSKLTYPGWKRNNVLEAAKIEIVFYGNITEQDAATLSEQFARELNARPLSNQETLKPCFFLEEKGPVLLTKKIPQLGNFACLIVQDPQFDLKREASLYIAYNLLQGPFFNTLRSEQQTGYVTKSIAIDRCQRLNALYFVQSTTHSPQELLSRFELFFESTLHNPELFSLSSFEGARNAWVSQLSAPPKDMRGAANEIDKIVIEYDADFATKAKQIEAAKNLTLEEFTGWCKEFYGRQNTHRIALLLQGRMSGDRALFYQPVNSLKALRETGTYIEKLAVK